MSLDPVLARHYINAPKPIASGDPARSSTTSHSSTHSRPSFYSRDHLLALSPSASPNPHTHPDDLHQLPALMPASASKIDSVNRILRKDSADFLDTLAASQAKGEKDQEAMRARSQTMPVPALLLGSNEEKEQGNKSNTTIVEMGPGTEVMEGEYDPIYGQKLNQTLQGLGGKFVDTPRSEGFGVDSPMELYLDNEGDISISVELQSAKRLPLSSAIPIPRSGSLTPRAASSIFNQQQSSGKYTPTSPSPLSLSLAQSMSQTHHVLRSAQTSTKGKVTIISSLFEDLPWRRPSLAASPITPDPKRPPSSTTSTPRQSLNAFAPPFPLPPTSITASRPALIARAESTTLPLPPPPPSLPAKPTSILPPVFVKRETAMLPQSMALPTVPPMGEDWEGERSLSGNEKRRRASHAPIPLGGRDQSLTGSMSRLNFESRSSAGSNGRSEKLVRLGERLKEHIRPV